MKRFSFALVITLLLALAVLPGSALAASCGEDLSWTLSGGVLTISGTGDMTDYGGSSSTEAPWYKYAKDISRIVVEEGVTGIGAYAFYSCHETELSLPSTLTRIGMFAFRNNLRLQRVTIPAGVVKLDAGQFAFCSALESFTLLGDTVLSGEALLACPKLADENGFVIFSDVLFGYYGENTHPVIPAGVRVIGTSAFDAEYCETKITGVDIPEGVKEICPNAFAGCEKLTSVSLPDSVVSLNANVFNSCESLESVRLPKDLTALNNDLFIFCSALRSCEIPSGVTVIGDNVFNGCRSLESVNIPEGVTDIGTDAFSGCSKLRSVTLPKSLIDLGASAFSGCEGIESITIPEKVTAIGNGTFSNCAALSSVSFPKTLKSFGESAFSNCSALTSIKIPSGVWELPDSVFANCSALVDITLPAGLGSIGKQAFFGCTSLAAIDLPKSVLSIGESAFDSCKALKDIALPGKLTTLGAEAFSNCESLETITIPASLKNAIGYGTFWHCKSLKTVAVWASRAIAYRAFIDCPVLEELFLFNPPAIAQGAFESCPAIRHVYYGGSEADWQAKELGNAFSLTDPTVEYDVLEPALAQLREDQSAFLEAYQSYIAKVTKEVKELAEAEKSEESVSFSDQAQAMRESGRFYVNALNLSGQTLPEGVELAAYEALCRAIDEVGEDAGIDLSEISGSSIPTATVKAVAKGFSGYTKQKELDTAASLGGGKSSKTRADIKIGNYSGAFMGTITVTVASTGKQYMYSVVSSPAELQNVISAYFTQLHKLGNKAVENVYETIIDDLLETPLENLTTKIITEKLTPAIASKLAEKGISHLSDTLQDCASGYKTAKDLLGKLEKLDVTNMSEAVDALSASELTEIDSGEWTGSFAKGLSKKLYKSQKKLIADWIDFESGALSFTEERESPFRKLRTIFHCPVSVAVFDEAGTQIGYVGEDDVWYTDAIGIYERGGSKITESDVGTKLSFAVTGTDDGTVSCAVTSTDETGAFGGRLNYYGLSVHEGTEIGVALKSGETKSEGDVALTLAGELQAADALIETEEGGTVNVQCTCENGSVLGAGAYLAGDRVYLVAYPGEGYVFAGWYDEAGTLLSVDMSYGFVAREDCVITARFEITAELDLDAEEPAFSLSAALEGGRLTVTSEHAAAGTVLTAAFYDTAGAFLGSEVYTPGAETDSRTLQAPEETFYALVFATDDDGIPLIEPVRADA